MAMSARSPQLHAALEPRLRARLGRLLVRDTADRRRPRAAHVLARPTRLATRFASLPERGRSGGRGLGTSPSRATWRSTTCVTTIAATAVTTPSWPRATWPAWACPRPSPTPRSCSSRSRAATSWPAACVRPSSSSPRGQREGGQAPQAARHEHGRHRRSARRASGGPARTSPSRLQGPGGPAAHRRRRGFGGGLAHPAQKRRRRGRSRILPAGDPRGRPFEQRPTPRRDPRPARPLPAAAQAGRGGHGGDLSRQDLRHRGVREDRGAQADPPAPRRERDFVRMFLDEARLAATLDHPNIVRSTTSAGR
jgi:hypothetical protein